MFEVIKYVVLKKVVGVKSALSNTMRLKSRVTLENEETLRDLT